MNGDISYNSNDLQTFDRATKVGINTNVIDHTNIPEKTATLFAMANANHSYMPSITYPSRKISIAGTIHGSTQTDLDSRIDTFKSYFTQKDKKNLFKAKKFGVENFYKHIKKNYIQIVKKKNNLLI